MEDNEENRKKLLQFIAQEVVKDKKIPHFDKSAIETLALSPSTPSYVPMNWI